MLVGEGHKIRRDVFAGVTGGSPSKTSGGAECATAAAAAGSESGCSSPSENFDKKSYHYQLVYHCEHGENVLYLPKP